MKWFLTLSALLLLCTGAFAKAPPKGKEFKKAPILLKAKAPTQAKALDLNKASLEQLVGLPGIGKVKAKAIIEARSAKPFLKVEDLLKVKGIGPATLKKFESRVAVLAPPAKEPKKGIKAKTKLPVPKKGVK